MSEGECMVCQRATVDCFRGGSPRGTDECWRLGYARLESELSEARAAHVEADQAASDLAEELAAAESALSAERTARVEAERDGDRVRVVVLDFLSSHSPQECAGRGECVCDDAWPLVGLPFGAVDQARRTSTRARAALGAEPGDAGGSGVRDDVVRDALRALREIQESGDVDPESVGSDINRVEHALLGLLPAGEQWPIPPEGHPGAAARAHSRDCYNAGAAAAAYGREDPGCTCPSVTKTALPEVRTIAQQEARAERDREWRAGLKESHLHPLLVNNADAYSKCPDCKSLRALLEGK